MSMKKDDYPLSIGISIEVQAHSQVVDLPLIDDTTRIHVRRSSHTPHKQNAHNYVTNYHRLDYRFIDALTYAND